MGEIKDFNKFKNAKSGYVTPEEIVTNLAKSKKKLKGIIVIGVEEGEVWHGYSAMSPVEVVGLLEIVKFHIIACDE